MMKTTIKGAQKMVDPPMQMPDDGFLLPVKMAPGSINYYRAGSPQTDRIASIETGGKPDIGLEMINDRRDHIVRAFFADLMQMQQKLEMTATEVLQRQEDRMRLIAPMVGRMQTESLSPIIERVYNVMVRRGRIPEPPIEVGSLRVEYTSPVVQAQKATRLFAVTRLFEAIAPLAQVKPAILDKLDEDGTFDFIHEQLQAPMSMKKNDDEVAQLREERREAQEAAQQAENLQRAGPGIKALEESARESRST